MDENSRRNLEAAERAERYLKGIPPHLRGPATRILVSNPPPSTERGSVAPSLRCIEGKRAERQSPSQRSLLVSVPRTDSGAGEEHH